MPYNFTVSPDFSPAQTAGWYYFNTWLQRQLGVGIHLELYDDFENQREDIRQGKVDLIYANPYDASMLVREQGFKALVRPVCRPDETVVVAHKDSVYASIESLKPNIRVATANDPDVHTMGMMLIEPADLGPRNIDLHEFGSYVLVAKELMQEKADVGFFLKEAYEQLSPLTRADLRVLVTSEISVIHHMLLIGPEMRRFEMPLTASLLAMSNQPKSRQLLDDMGMTGWEMMLEEETEFMIDLMETLA